MEKKGGGGGVNEKKGDGYRSEEEEPVSWNFVEDKWERGVKSMRYVYRVKVRSQRSEEFDDGRVLIDNTRRVGGQDNPFRQGVVCRR